MLYISRILIVFLIIVSLSGFINRKKKDHTFDIRKLEKSLCLVKPGLYACAFELTNFEYRLFLNDLKKRQQQGWQNNLPDSTNWADLLAYNQPMVENYHNHDAYSDYPVCNINHENANAYCKWLTDKYNSSSKKKFDRVLFRLPTVEEWEMAARGGKQMMSYPMGPYLRRYDGRFMYNYRRFSEQNITADPDGNPMIVPSEKFSGIYSYHQDALCLSNTVESYWPNDFGIYNICGNVAEMVQEKGISKGGSFRNFAFNLRIEEQGEYSESSSDLGFRVFLEVVSENAEE